MESIKYLEDLLEAIKFVYQYSDGYFKTKNRRERSIVFRIAHHLANKIEGEGVFVDIEPTRCNGIKKTCCHERDGQQHRIYPDLIVHRRGKPGDLVAEFKCSENEWEHDFNKLKCLTTPKGQRENQNTSTPYYELGVFIYLTDKFNNIEIKVFRRGEEDEKLTLQYQNKIRINGEEHA